MLEAIELTKNYNGTPALDALNLKIEAGDVYCLLGANGAGKTTMLFGKEKRTFQWTGVCF